MWDLQRNGGNLAATTERMLSGRGLETVCSSFPVDMSAGGSDVIGDEYL